MLDPKTGKAKIRLVDTHSTRYAIARRYMIRLRRDDFEDAHELAKFAATCGLHLPEFRQEFEYLIQDEPPKLDLEKDAAEARAEDGAHQHH
jgi:6-phosphofructokinase 1